MTLNLRMVMEVERGAAKAALDDTARGIKGVTAATAEQATKSRTAATAADAEAAAKRRNAQASREMTVANRQAAGATGNLVAQFNDIGMMLAAGQSPLQLAIQQGTSITQVIGPMGAAGAAKALGAAFVSMISPLNLITLGVIAGTAALVQWATSSSDAAAEADALTAATERQKAVFDGLKSVLDDLSISRQMLTSGAATEAEQTAMNENLRLTTERNVLEIQRAELIRQANENMGFLNQAELDVLNTKIAANEAAQASNNQLLKNIEAERQKNAETARAVDLAGQVATATAKIGAALQAADGSRLVAAFQSAFPVASQLLGMAQGIMQTIGAANAQAAAYESAQMGGLAAQYAQYGAGRVSGERLARESGSLYGGRRVIPAPVVSGGGGGGGGGGAAARDEADALQELIASLEAEIDALRVQDPIQQEMLRHREALAGATDAERQKVEELIATREREQVLMEGAKARAEFFADIGNQALESLIMKGASFNDVLKQMISSLIQAVAQAALLGTGPFGSLFGGTSILGQIFPALGGGKAEGGMVYGPGTGTSDSILTALSNGEFVVNARSTAKNRQLLEAINAGGRVPGYADGGYVGSDSGRLSGRSGRDLPATIYLDFRGVKGDREIEATARQAAAQVVAMYDREGLPVSMKRVSGDPRRTG